MSEAESFSPKSADFLVAGEKKPRFNLRGVVNLEKSKNAATIIAANALRAHQDIAVSGSANVADRLFVNGVEMCGEHDGSLTVDENEIVLAE